MRAWLTVFQGNRKLVGELLAVAVVLLMAILWYLCGPPLAYIPAAAPLTYRPALVVCLPSTFALRYALDARMRI